MNEQEYKQFYDRIANRIGWDFSNLRCASEGEKWDFYQEVTQQCKNTDILLDIGTGGGEKLLSIADAALLLVGIDNSSKMIKAAKSNLDSSSVVNVRFMQMDAEQIMFPDQFFNVVSCRQAPFHAPEAARVLRDGGVFLTQQVSENDKLNMKEAFGRGLTDAADGTLKNQYVKELRDAGFRDVQAYDYDAAEWYHSYEDLLFLLQHTPIIPNFGQCDNDFSILADFIREHQTGKGIVTNSKRFMIIARK